MEIDADFNGNIALKGGLSLQAAGLWEAFIGEEKAVNWKHHTGELYFEEKDMASYQRRLEAWGGIEFVHPLKE